jgi:hypothetical protein
MLPALGGRKVHTGLLPNEAALLRSCSWHCERLFRRDHVFKTITFMTVTAGGSRAMFDTPCCAPKGISDTRRGVASSPI